jgi:hypothetical protein
MTGVASITPDELRRERKRESNRRYRESEKGRANARERQRRYRQTEHGKRARSEIQRRYRASGGERDCCQRWRAAAKNDPDKQQMLRAARERRRERIKSDPVQYEKFLRYKREYNRRVRQARRANDVPTFALRSALLTNDLYAAAWNATPRGLPDHLRDDIISDIVMGVLSGDFTADDIPAKAKAIISANRKHNSKWGPLSLDAERFDGSTRTLHDSISEGMWQ